MRFNEFVKTIQEAGDVKDTLNVIAKKLLESVGIGDYAENTIASFIKGKRHPIWKETPKDADGFIQYLSKNTRSTWEDMQKASTEKDEYGFINRDTTDAEIFYRSLLALFFDILRFTPTSLRHILPAEPLLFGREDELKQIEDTFKEKNYVVLTGIGGIGKSQTALAYAHKMNKSGGWTIQHVLCEETDTLRRAVNKLQIDDLYGQEEEGKEAQEIFNYRVQVLKNSLNPTLVILDNLNRPFKVEDRKDFAKLKECGHHIQFLITSRNNWGWGDDRAIPISSLGDDALTKLYTYHRFDDSYDHSSYITEHKDIINKLFALVGNHTLMITLLARLANDLILSEQKIYDLLELGLRYPKTKGYITKDGADIEGDIEEITKVIFDISSLTDTQKDIMKHMSIMPLTGIECKLFEELTGFSLEIIKPLIRSHWITEDEEALRIRLHPLIRDVMLNLFYTNEDCEESTDENRNENNVVERLVKQVTEFMHKVLALEDGCVPGSSRWHDLNKIANNYAYKVISPWLIDRYGFNRTSKDELSSAFFTLYDALKDYSDSPPSACNAQMVESAQKRHNQPLKKIYTFLFGDCLHVSIPEGKNAMDYTVYVLFGYDVNGYKDILGIWLSKSEDKYYWKKAFCDIKTRGVEDILFISVGNTPGLEEAAKSIFKDVIVQQSIAHLIRNSSKCIPDEDRCRAFTARIKKVYNASSLEDSELEFERLAQKWNNYPDAVNVWSHSWACVEHLFSYGSAVRRVMCAADWIEDVYPSFCNVVEKGSFLNEDALRASLYLQNITLTKKWNKRRFYNWKQVRGELALDKKMQERIMKYAEH